MTLAVVIIIVLLAVLGFGYLIFRMMRKSQETVPRSPTARRRKARPMSSGTDEQGGTIHASEDLQEPATRRYVVRVLSLTGRDPRPGPRRAGGAGRRSRLVVPRSPTETTPSDDLDRRDRRTRAGDARIEEAPEPARDDAGFESLLQDEIRDLGHEQPAADDDEPESRRARERDGSQRGHHRVDRRHRRRRRPSDPAAVHPVLPGCRRSSRACSSTRSTRASSSTSPRSRWTATSPTTRRWTSTTSRSPTSPRCATGPTRAAFRMSQFLYYYRMIGVIGFEITQVPGGPVHLPEHVRVLLPLRRGSCGSAGTPAAWASGRSSSPRPPSGSSSSCRRSGGSTSPSST